MVFGMNFDELSDVEKKIVSLAIGVDTLAGGDALAESGTKHYIIDTWTSGMIPPSIYYEDAAVYLKNKGGVGGCERIPATVYKYIDRNRLHELPEDIRADLNYISSNRRQYLRGIVRTFEVILNTLDPRVSTPSYDERYKTVTGINKAEVIDIAPYRESLEDALTNANYKVERSLRDAFIKWKINQGYVGAKADGTIDSNAVKEKFTRTLRILLDRANKNLLSQMDFGIPGYSPDLSEVRFDGLKLKLVNGANFTGSSIYRGQGVETPLLQGLLEYNTDHPMTPGKLVHIASHEGIIGHYFNSAVADLLWRGGKLPFEATMEIMCSPSAVFQEGWAENALLLIYGSREKLLEGVEHDFGVKREDMAVTLAYADLKNVATHNVSILYQREGEHIDEVRTYLRDRCFMSDAKVKTLSGIWTQDPIFGPMYGPTYLIGTMAVRNAIEKVGAVKVAQVGLQTTGRLLDITIFNEQIYK